MDYIIEKNVPIPLKRTKGTYSLSTQIRDILLNMEIGDSLKVDKKGYSAFGNAKKYSGDIALIKFKAFAENGGFRIFRIE